MFGSKTSSLGFLLLLLFHYTHTFVLLTANIEDVKKIARKFVSEPFAEQIAQFIVKASGQAVASNVSAENEQNAGEVLELSENELDQFSKAARQKYDTKVVANRYKQQTQSTSPRTPAKIEYVEDKSEINTDPPEPLVQHKKTKSQLPDIYEDKKRKISKPRHVETNEEPKKEPKLIQVEEMTTRQQKRWKLKESEDESPQEERRLKTTTIKRQRLRKKKSRELNIEDDQLSFQLVHQNENNTNNHQRTDTTFPDVPKEDDAKKYVTSKERIYEKHVRAKKIMEKPITYDRDTKQKYNRDTRPREYNSKYDERPKSRSRARTENRHALLKAPDEEPINAHKKSHMSAPIIDPMDAPMDTPLSDPMEISFKNAKTLEPTEGTIIIEFSPRVNAFNIAAGNNEPQNENKNKVYLRATSGPIVLPMVSVVDQIALRRRIGSIPKPQQVHEILM